MKNLRMSRKFRYFAVGLAATLRENRRKVMRSQVI